MTARTSRSVWCRAAIPAYDWLYRVAHRLNAPVSEVGPVLRVEIRRSRWSLRLSDGTAIRRGDPVGFLHLNNDRVVALHSDGLSPISVGLEFRRRLIDSLLALAELAGTDGRLAQADRAVRRRPSPQALTAAPRPTSRTGYASRPDAKPRLRVFSDTTRPSTNCRR